MFCYLRLMSVCGMHEEEKDMTFFTYYPINAAKKWILAHFP